MENRLRELVRKRYRRWVETAKFWDRLYNRAATLPTVEKLEELVVRKYRENFKCPYCGREMSVEFKRSYTWREATGWVLEHMIPHSLGGDDRIENLTIACHGCNIVKGSMRAETYISVFRSLPDNIRLSWLDESYRGWMMLRYMRDDLMNQVEELLDIKEELREPTDEEIKELVGIIKNWLKQRSEHV